MFAFDTNIVTGIYWETHHSHSGLPPYLSIVRACLLSLLRRSCEED